MHSSNELIQFYQMSVSFYSQTSQKCFKITNYRNRFFGIWRKIHSSKKMMKSFQDSVFRNNQSSISCKCIVFECYLYTSGTMALLIKYFDIQRSHRKHLSIYVCSLLQFAITFCVWLVNSFQKVRVEISLFPEYIIDDTLNNDTPNQIVIMVIAIVTMTMKIILLLIMRIMIIITIMIIMMMIMITIMIIIMVIEQ